MKLSASEYVYHGSPTGNIDELIPNRAKNGDMQDSDVAVYASDDIDYAIFMALIGSNGWGGWDHRIYSGKGFYIHEEFLDYLTSDEYDVEGYVYVLERTGFTKSNGEFRSPSKIRPIGSLAVSTADLPSDIHIEPRPHPYYLSRA